MNCGIKNHSIELKNLENICFSRQIIRVFGKIANPCENKNVEIYQNDCEEPLKSIIVKKNFKHLLYLRENSTNIIRFKYCNEIIEIQIHHKSTDNINYDVQPIYIIPKNHDGKFQSIDNKFDDGIHFERALKKINTLMQLAQCIISSKISESDEITFVLNKCEVFHSFIDVVEAREINQFDLYDKIAAELLTKFGYDTLKKRKFVGFLSCTEFLGLDENEAYNYANIQRKTRANPSLGSGFLALLGSGTFFSLPDDSREVINAFSDKTIVDTKRLLDDSNYRRTFGGCFSTTLGTLCHEMGHIFDLGHTLTGLMGNDIDFVHRYFLNENFITEIMPKRNISNCQQQTINNADRNCSQKRLTKINKNGAYMEKYHEQKDNDMSFFEGNCSIILRNHKWFTQNEKIPTLHYNDEEKTINSLCESLALVEVRQNKSALLKKFWDLTGKDLKTFHIDINLDDSTIFAITQNGNIFKKNL